MSENNFYGRVHSMEKAGCPGWWMATIRTAQNKFVPFGYATITTHEARSESKAWEWLESEAKRRGMKLVRFV